MGLSYLFIAHNLAVVEHFADDVAVMYLGRIVETAKADTLYAQPLHPYTQSLLASVPSPDPSARTTLAQLPGETPSPIDPPPGCAFHPRCPLTRQLGLSLPAGETTEIISDGQGVRIAKRCVMGSPQLLATSDDATHAHACLMRL